MADISGDNLGALALLKMETGRAIFEFRKVEWRALGPAFES